MQKIPFDIKYRPEIESGRYKVETNVGRPVRILAWDAKNEDPLVQLPIVGLVDYGKREMVFTWDIRGLYGNNDMDLIIVTDWKGLDDVKQRLILTLSAINEEHFESSEIEKIAQDETEVLLKYFQDILRPQPHWKPSKEQMEVDLEKEFQEYWYLHHYDHRLRRQVMDGHGKAVLRNVAGHFYELGRISQTK